MKQNNYMLCPTCKGKKYVYDHFLCVGTLGLGYLMGKDKTCPNCDGKGFIKIPNDDDDRS